MMFASKCISMGTNSGGILGSWYRSRIGEPQTDDEVWGYWAFVLGALFGLAALALFLYTTPDTTTRALAFASGAAAVAMLLFGPVIRLPLSRNATYLAALGMIVCAAAILYFFTIYPQDWTRPNGNEVAILLYAVGILLILLGGTLMPLIAGRSERELASTREEMAATTAERDDLQRDLADTEDSLAAALADRDESGAALAAAQATLASQQESKAAFEMYEDNAEEWRWRLRHRNGNVIADGGEGYSSRQKAMQGLQSVKRNSLGAAVTIQRVEEDAPEEPPEVLVADSQATFEFYEDKGGSWRWRLRHDNGEIIADGGEGYHNRSNVRRAIRSVTDQIPKAAALSLDPVGFEVYADAGGDWRWRLLHRNGNILADGGQGFASRSNATRAVETVREVAANDDAFEVYEDNAGEYRWRLTADNGEVVADSGEGYSDRSGATEAVERVTGYAPEADALDVNGTVFELYEDNAEEWRWRLRNRNGKIVADSGEGYGKRSKARAAIDSVKRHAPGADSEAV